MKCQHKKCKKTAYSSTQCKFCHKIFCFSHIAHDLHLCTHKTVVDCRMENQKFLKEKLMNQKCVADKICKI